MVPAVSTRRHVSSEMLRKVQAVADAEGARRMMDTSKLPHAKPRPAALERKDRRNDRKAQDEQENAKVKARSGGQCEVWIGRFERCARRGNQTHHMIGGWGKRARGISILAEHKQYVCHQCHDDIGGHILKRIGGDPPR